MKILNKISILSVLMIVLSLVSASCTDDEKNPLNGLLTKEGGFVRFTEVIPPNTIGAQAVDQVSYSFDISDANNNVATYDLSVAVSLGGGDPTDFFPLSQVTSFPASLTYTIQELTAAIGISVDDVSFGDQFLFSGIVTTNDGTVYSAEELFFGDPDEEDDIEETVVLGQGVTSDLLDNDGYRQAFEFDFTILCPSAVASDMVGTFEVLFHRFDAFFDPQGDTRVIVQGPEDNQITIIGGALPVDGGGDLIINLFDDGTISYGGESGVVHFNTFGPGNYGGVSGTVFSCIGAINITIATEGFIDNFLNLVKVSDDTGGINL